MSYYTDKRFQIIDAKEEKGRLWRVWNRYFKDMDGRILDAGCSVGNFISLSPEKIVGIDIDTDAIEVCKKRGFDVCYADLDKGLEFPDDYFDAIYSNHSIEHTQYPILTLNEFYRVLKEGGKLVLFTPNVYRDKFKFFDEYTHKKPFTPKSLEEIAYNAGFGEFKIYQEHRSLVGLGMLARKGVSADMILKIQDLLAFLKVTSKDLVLEVVR